jgi:hypothetical protein
MPDGISIWRKLAGLWGEALVIAIAVLLWLPRLSGPIDLRWDASVYYLLGTSLANGDGYRIASEPGSPEALQYPPLLPAFIALHQRALGTSDVVIVGSWLRITYAILFSIYAVAILRLARRYLRPIFAVTATLLCVLNPFTIFLSDLLFAEIPFAVLSVLFALAAETSSPPERLREAGSFALATAGFLLRSAGLALLGAWVLQAVMWRRWKLAAVRGILALLPFVAWQAYVARVHSSPAYSHPAYEYQRAPYQYYNVSYAENMKLIDPFQPELGRLTSSALLTRIASNLTTIPGAMGQIVSAKEKDWRGTMLWLQGLVTHRSLFPISLIRVPIFALAVLVVAGLVAFLYRRAWIMLFIVLGSIALVCATPWPGQFTRYLEPLSPFLAIAAVLGLCTIAQGLSERSATRSAVWVQAAAAALLLASVVVELHTAAWLFGERARQRVAFAGKGGEAQAKWFIYDETWRAWQEATQWVAANASPKAILATSAPHFYYLQTGRLAVLPPMEADGTKERQLLARVPANYVVVDELEFPDIARRYVGPAVANDSGWRQVYSAQGTKVYERSGIQD